MSTLITGNFQQQPKTRTVLTDLADAGFSAEQPAPFSELTNNRRHHIMA